MNLKQTTKAFISIDILFTMNLQFLLQIHIAIDSWTKKGNLRPISQLTLIVSQVKPT
jgi:hypothetical protein